MELGSDFGLVLRLTRLAAFMPKLLLLLFKVQINPSEAALYSSFFEAVAK